MNWTDWIQEGPNGNRFDTSGPLRVEIRKESFFVVGHGEIRSVESIFEGNQMIRDLTNAMICKENKDDSISRDSSNCVGPMDGVLPVSRF